MPATSKTSAKGATNAKKAQAPKIMTELSSLSSLELTDTKEPSNAKPGRIGTRMDNANQRPGEVQKALTRKRRTPDEMKAFREAEAIKRVEKEEASLAKEAEKKLKYKRVAAAEEKMHDANEEFFATPRPKPRPRGRVALQRTMAYLELPVNAADVRCVGQGADVAMDIGNDGELVSGSPVTTDAEEGARPLKKAKVNKGKGKAPQKDDSTDEEANFIGTPSDEDGEMEITPKPHAVKDVQLKMKTGT